MPAKTSSRSAAPAPAASARMAELITGLTEGEGFLPSRLPGVTLLRSTIHIPRSPIAYEPSVVIMAQGRKIGHLGARRFVYDASNYLVLTVPLPFECETIGTPDEPVLGVSVGFTPALVTDLVLQLQSPAPPGGSAPRAIEAARLDEGLGGAAVRLLESLRSDDDARILGPQLVREIAYRVLHGPLGPNLRALAAPHSHFGAIGRVLHRLHVDYDQSASIDALARLAGMSVSTFHAHFKAVTASSPLQYLKAIRLHKARLLMVNDGANAAQAAHLVGYESASQFSREFKRFFGDTPAEEAARLRANLVVLA